MKIYSIYNFNELIIEEIKKSDQNWSLQIGYLDDFLVQLPKLVQKFDLSEIITKVRFNSLTVFNNVGTRANFGQIAKWAEDAIKKENEGDNSDHQWKAILAVLEQAKKEGIDYCSLIRGWEGSAISGKGAAQGDQILKLLSKNLQTTKNHEIKSAIFELIKEEADKGQKGLYGIPDNYKSNKNVQNAATEHKKFVDNELQVLKVRWDTMPLEEQSFITKPTKSKLEKDVNQSTLTKKTDDSLKIDMEQEINNTNELLIEYKKQLIILRRNGLEEEDIKSILAKNDEDMIINALSNEFSDARKNLIKQVKEIAIKLNKYYENLSLNGQSIFKGSKVCEDYNKLSEELIGIENLSDDLRYPLAKIMLVAPKNLLECLGKFFGGVSSMESEQILKDFVKEYESTHPNSLQNSENEVNTIGNNTDFHFSS